MHPMILGLAIFAVALFVHVTLVQRARRKLTPEQLHALERLSGLSASRFVPVLPLLLVAATASYFPAGRATQFFAAVLMSVGLFLLSSWRSRARIVAAGLPIDYARHAFAGEVVLTLGTVGMLAPLAPHVSW